jgi:hypothetical protein
MANDAPAVTCPKCQSKIAIPLDKLRSDPEFDVICPCGGVVSIKAGKFQSALKDELERVRKELERAFRK